MAKIIVRIEKDDVFPNTYMVTTQTIGYPKTTGFIEGLGDTVGLGGESHEINNIAMEVMRDMKESNPNAQVTLKGKLR